MLKQASGIRMLISGLSFSLILFTRLMVADDLVYAFKGVLPPGSSAHSNVSDGETFTAVFTIDPSVADSNPSATEGTYPDSVVAGTLVFSGGYAASTSFSGFDVLVFNDAGSGPIDGVSVRDSGFFIQASTRELATLTSDALPLDPTEFESGPDPDTLPFFQLTYNDPGGTITYNATVAHNVQFRAKNGIAWRNVAGSSPFPFFDLSGNWLAGVDGGPPSTTDTALFSLARTYEVWWDNVTGDQTVGNVCVTDGNVTIDNTDGGSYNLNVDFTTEIAGSAELSIGDGVDSLDIDVGSSLIVDGTLNAFQATSISVGMLSDIGRDDFGSVNIDGMGTVLETGPGAMYIGAETLGELRITDGAIAVDDGSPRIGGAGGGIGLVDVVGDGSAWTAAGTIHIGNFPDTIGYLTVEDSASVNAGGNIEAGFTGNDISNSIAVDAATLTAGNDIRIGGSGSAFLLLQNNGEASAAGQIFIAATGIVRTEAGGTPELDAVSIWNQGTMALDGDIGADIRGDLLNSGSIHSLNSAANFFYDDLIHDGLEIETDALAVTRIFGTASGPGPYTGSGQVVFDGDLNPGFGSGIGNAAAMTFSGEVVLNSAVTVNIEIASRLPGQHDQLVVAGDFEINSGSALSVSTIDGFTPCNGDEFLIAEVGGTRTGTFAGLAEGSLAGNFGATDLFISYEGGDGNDIVLNAVSGFLLGDVNLDCVVNLLDVQPFIDLLVAGGYQAEADINGDGSVNLLDVDPLVVLLTGG